MCIKKVLSILFIGLFISSCSTLPKPNPINSLFPVDQQNLKYENGHPVILMKQENANVSLGFIKKTNEGFVFEMTVTNNSAKPILFDPVMSYYSINVSSITVQKEYAIDPESKINEIDNKLEKEKPACYTAEQTDAFSDTLDVALDIVDIFKTNTEEEIRIKEEKEKAEEKEQEEKLKKEVNEMKKYESLKNELLIGRTFWAEESLRKNTVESDKFIKGYISFPYNQNANQMKMIINIEDKVFEFDFKG
ncbi:hypothetical protein KAU39_02880 [bacterium]|nr:hypothetical protein [bacterium]